jgi:hypothetical protein
MKAITSRCRIGAAALLATSLVTGFSLSAHADDIASIAIPADAPAAPRDSVTNRKDKCLNSIDQRIADIGAWKVQLDGWAKVTVEAKDALRSELTLVATNLDTIARPAIVAATTTKEIKAACQSVVTDYRVYVVLHPRVFVSATADATLVSAEAMRVHLIDVTGGAGNGDIQALLERAVNNANAALTTVAPITAGSYNASPAPTKAALKAARAQLKAAKKDLVAAKAKLKKLATPAAPTPPTTVPGGICSPCS